MVTGGTRSRLIAIAVMGAVFMAGGAAGFAMHNLVAAEEAPTVTQPRQERTNGERRERHSIFDDLGLTVEQRAKVDSILEKRNRDMDAFWQQHGPDMRAIYDSTKAEIDRTLTEEQRIKMQEFRDRRRKDRDRDEGKPDAHGPRPPHEKDGVATPPPGGATGEKGAPSPAPAPDQDRATREKPIPQEIELRPVLATYTSPIDLKHA